MVLLRVGLPPRDGTRVEQAIADGRRWLCAGGVWQTGGVASAGGVGFPAARRMPLGAGAADLAARDRWTGGVVTDWVLDEVELVRRCREGSDAAYAVLVREHRPRLFTLAHRLTGDRATAEDVVQEAFLAAFKAIDRFEPKPSLAAWLNTITVRIAKRAASRARARADTSLGAIEGDGDPRSAAAGRADLGIDGDPVAAAESAELRAQVAAAIERLPFNYRAAVVLRFVTGLDYAAAAEAMAVPLNTFRSHLLRGTKLLRADLASRFEPAGDRDVPGLDARISSAPTPEPVLDRAATVPGGIGVPAPTPPRRS